MSRPLAIIAAAGLMFIAGCEKKPSDTVPTVAPESTSSAADILGHLQYTMVRKDPKHFEVFAPEAQDMFLGAVAWFHNHAGAMGLKLTEEEIKTIGVEDFVQKGYISPNWSRSEFNAALKELDSGKGLTPEMEKSLSMVNQARLDMPLQTIPDKKLAEKMKNDLTEAIEANPKAIYAAGLYRVLKAIPANAWQYIEATVASNAGGVKGLNDVRLRVGETEIVTVTVGNNPDGGMFICYLQFKKYPSAIAKMFPDATEGAKK